MKPIFINSKDFQPDDQRFGRGRSDEELMSLRQSVLSGAYVVHAAHIADAILAEAWFEEMTHALGH